MTHRPLPLAALVVALLAAITAVSGPPPAAAAGPSATPVAPHRSVVPLAGISDAGLADAAALAPAAQAARLTAAGVAPLAVAPEIVTAPTDEARFDAIGVTWARAGAPADIAVWVRTREAAGWTPWELLGRADTGPDAGTAEAARARDRDGTEPLVTDAATAFQVRIDASGDLTDATAELIDAGRSPADGARPGAAPAPEASAALASGAPARPFVISRAQWGADESLRGGPPDYTGPTKVAVVHHTVTSNSYSPTSAYAEIRSIYAYHTLSLGYNDIAYNVLVDRYGQIFEGRYGGLENPVLSAATAAFNTNTFSVSALGSYDIASPTPELVESISEIVAWKLAISYVNPVGESQLTSAGYDGSPHPAGEVVTFPNIIGHRDAFPTACPGQYLYDDLDYIRQRVLQLTPAGLVHPTVDVTPRTLSSNGSAHIVSGLLYGGQWAVTILRPDGSTVTVFTGSGGAIDVTWPMTDGGVPAPERSYGVRIQSSQNGTTTLDFNSTILTTGIVGSLDSLLLTPSGFQAAGWAAVTDGGTATAIVGSDADPVAQVAATAPRPDVAAVFPALGAARGFTLPFPVSVGVHLVCAGAVAADLPTQWFGCFYVTSPRSEPIGHVDSITPEYGGVRIEGWALDRDSAASILVRTYFSSGVAGDALANTSRPDVAAIYPVYGPNHGFVVDLSTGPGPRHACINGLNVGAGSGDGGLLCPDLMPVTGLPIGSLDVLSTSTVEGWTFDPDSTGPIDVHLYIDGAFRGAYTAGGARPDLAAPFPLMGTAHGYVVPLPTLGAGSHTVCVYAIGVGPPTANPLLGCRNTH